MTGIPVYDWDQTCGRGRNLSSFLKCSGGKPNAPTNFITPDNMCPIDGSVILPDTLTYTESIEILGVPFSLVYSNNKVRGRKDWNHLRIPVMGDNPYDSQFLGKKLEIKILDRKLEYSFEPMAGLVTSFEWDGKDSDGNIVDGVHLAKIALIERNDNFCDPAMVIGVAPGEVREISTYEVPLDCVYSSPITFNLPIGSIFTKTLLLVAGTLR